MAEKGLTEVSLRNVAAAADVSMGQVQHYFTTKQELIHHACRTILDLANLGHRSTSHRPPRERLRHLTHQAIPERDAGHLGAGAWYAFVTAAATDPGLAEIVRESWEGLHSTMTTLIAELMPEASPDDVAQQARVLAATMDGLVLRTLTGSLTPAEAKTALDVLIESL